jgi:hypothetical protein
MSNIWFESDNNNGQKQAPSYEHMVSTTCFIFMRKNVLGKPVEKNEEINLGPVLSPEVTKQRKRTNQKSHVVHTFPFLST